MLDWLKRAFLDNFILKLVSLLLAIGLWLAVASAPPAGIEMRVPIEFRNLPENLEIDSASFTEAQVRLRGPERVLHSISPADVTAEVDLSNVQPGERTFDLTARHVHVPYDVEVEQIIPGQFHLSFDVRETRTVEVHPRVTGTFANGLRVAQVVADPPTITVVGPRRRVDALEAATTDPVDASGTISRATFTTQVFVGDPLVQVVHPAPIRVTVIMGR
ncbi:MAG TPA: CdaR family protein [Terriglobales bacterium]|nr:CdaR family protein [Terriglobales bacterium]